MSNKIINAFISHITEEEGDIPRLKAMMMRHGITADLLHRRPVHGNPRGAKDRFSPARIL